VTFVDTKVDYLKMEDAIVDAKHEVLVLQVEEKTICTQLEEMKNKSGTSFWAKPIVHPMLNNKFETYILVNLCGFCNRRYYCHDITVASCKHTSHLFIYESFLGLESSVLFVHKCSILIGGIVGALRRRMRMLKTWLWICVWTSCKSR